VCVRQLRPFGARAHRRAFGTSKKEAMRARSDGGEIRALPPKAVRASFPSRQAYHGAGNRLAPTAHFSEGGKTAYCNAIAYAICPLRRDIRKASGTEGVSFPRFARFALASGGSKQRANKQARMLDC